MDNIAPLDLCDSPDTGEMDPSVEGRRGPCSLNDSGATQLPLWLTAQEAELLTLLCAASPSAVRGEERLFEKVGELLRAFRR